MISKQDILLLRKKLISARALLMRNNPFFALLLMHIRYVAVPGMEQMSTNGETIFFSPDLMKKYSQNELCTLLCHQMMHILLGDIWRPLTLKGDDYHYERDLVVNAELKSCGIGMHYVYVRAIPSKKNGSRSFFSDNKRPRHMVDTDDFWSYELHDIENGVVILEAAEDIWAQRHEHTEYGTAYDSTSLQKGNQGGDCGNKETQQEGKTGRSNSKENFSQLKDLWENLLRRYHNIGTVPMGIKRYHNNNRNGHLDWKTLLADFIHEETFDYSFCPPDRRSDDIGFFLPDYSEKEFTVQDILFMIDTSASILDHDLSEAYAEMRHAIDLFNGKLTGWLGFFDTDVTEPRPFSSVDEISMISPYGGGGTDFRCVFDYMAKHFSERLPACMVIYTDGFGVFPSKKATLGVPVLWLINNDDAVPPFGKVVRIMDRDER